MHVAASLSSGAQEMVLGSQNHRVSNKVVEERHIRTIRAVLMPSLHGSTSWRSARMLSLASQQRAGRAIKEGRLEPLAPGSRAQRG